MIEERANVTASALAQITQKVTKSAYILDTNIMSVLNYEKDWNGNQYLIVELDMAQVIECLSKKHKP
jgi:hypothetical protein